MDDVRLDRQVVPDEIGRIRLVGDDSARPWLRRETRSQDVLGKERGNGVSVGQVELRVRSPHADSCIHLRAAHGRAPNRRARVTGDVDKRLGCHRINREDALQYAAATRSHGRDAPSSPRMPSHKVNHTLLWIVSRSRWSRSIAALLLPMRDPKAGYWLEARGQPPEKANAIVVLGGDDGERSLRVAGALPRRLRADHRADGSREGECARRRLVSPGAPISLLPTVFRGPRCILRSDPATATKRRRRSWR